MEFLLSSLMGPLFVVGIAGAVAVRCPRLLPRLLFGGILGALMGGIASHILAEHFILAPIRAYYDHLGAVHYHGFLCGTQFSQDFSNASRIKIAGCWLGGVMGVGLAWFGTGFVVAGRAGRPSRDRRAARRSGSLGSPREAGRRAGE